MFGRRIQHSVPDYPLTTRPDSSPAETFTVRNLLRSTVSLTGQAARPLLVLLAITRGPWALLTASGLLASESLIALSYLYEGTIGIVEAGALIWLVDGARRGERRSIGVCLSRAAKRYWSMLGAMILRRILVGVYMLLLVVPGVLKALRLSILIPTIIIEDKDATPAIERSERLMDGHLFPAFLTLAIALPLLAAQSGSLIMTGSGLSNPVFAGLEFIFNVVTVPFDVLCVALYAEAVRSDARFRDEVFGPELVPPVLHTPPRKLFEDET